MCSELAVLGGDPVREEPFIVGETPSERSIIGKEEVEAATRVIESQQLSGFLAADSTDFFGGEEVQALESEWCEFFDTEYAVAVNSWTSGLIASVAALDLPPGSEVIVPPLTMSASAAAVLWNDCVPVFADVDPDSGNLDPEAVREQISDDTEAILVVHLFGYPAEMDELKTIADENDLRIIEDAAHTPGATYNGEYAGTIGDIGGFSLNVHKHIQTGEGGIIVTDDEELARRAQLVRNHGEVAVSHGYDDVVGVLEGDYSDVVGQNYRMSETAAAMARCQLSKLPDILDREMAGAGKLRELLSGLEFVSPQPIRDGTTHAYYLFPLWFDTDAAGISLDRFLEALNAEGIPFSRYADPLYDQPVYAEGNIHTNGQVYSGPIDGTDPVEYESLSIAERLSRETVCMTEIILADATESDLEDIYEGIAKVESNIGDLR